MINKQLKEYIEKNVLPIYDNNEQGHGIKHIEYVVRRSLDFAQQVEGVDINMVYTIACYHNIGHHIDAKNHESVSADMFMEDIQMNNFFDDEKRTIIFEAIQDHRASGDGEPRSIYGKIVSSADRRTDMNNILTTTYTYGLKNYPNNTIEQNIEDAYSLVCRKFARGGYATEKMYFKDIDYEKLLEQAEGFKNNKKEFVKQFCEINNININDISL